MSRPRDMLAEFLNDSKDFAARQRTAHDDCDEFGDVGTASLLEIFDGTERRTWFSYETIVGGKHSS